MPTLRKRRRSTGWFWYLHWVEPGQERDASRGQRSRALGPCSELTEAQAKTHLKAKEIELGTTGGNRRPVQTFAQWCESYLAWHEQEFPASHFRVSQIARQYLAPVFGPARLDDIRRQDVEDYKIDRNAKPATIAKELRTLQAIINKAVEWEIIDRNPIKGVKPPKDLDDRPPRYFTEAELLAIYEASAWRRHWWRFMANTGLRRGEAINARWDDVHAGTLRVLSTAASRTKSGKSRGVRLSPGALESLEGIRNSRGGSRNWHEEYILPRMYPRSLSRCFEEDSARAGVPGTIHELRHTFCTQLVLAGVHLRKIQLLAGHSRIEITERYSKLLGEDMADDVAGLRI